MAAKVTIPTLHGMKREGQKIVGIVAWDFQIAQIADRAGVDLISVGDSLGVNLLGHASPLEITLDEMVVACKAVRRGGRRAVVSCDFPGPQQLSVNSAVRTATRLVQEGGADMVKVEGCAELPEIVTAIVRAGIPVFAQLEITPATTPPAEKLVADAKRLE